jgi:hypothetical protein
MYINCNFNIISFISGFNPNIISKSFSVYLTKTVSSYQQQQCQHNGYACCMTVAFNNIKWFSESNLTRPLICDIDDPLVSIDILTNS